MIVVCLYSTTLTTTTTVTHDIFLCTLIAQLCDDATGHTTHDLCICA